MTDLIAAKTAAARTTKKTVKFAIDDKRYDFKPPAKSGVLFSIIDDDSDSMRQELVWFFKGLKPEDADEIRERLLDLDDPMDETFLFNEVIRPLYSAIAALPTRPSSGS